MAENLLDILANSAVAAAHVNEHRNRRYGLFVGTCSATDDPLNKRRIKVTTGPKGGLTDSYWMWPMRLIPYYDPPMPRVGIDQVVCAFIDGDPHDGVWLGTIINENNPEFPQGDPVQDNSQMIPGASTETIGGDYTHNAKQAEIRTVELDLTSTVNGSSNYRTEQNVDISAGLRITIHNDAGAGIMLHESGCVYIYDKWGNRIAIGGASSGQSDPTDLVWDIITSDMVIGMNNHAIDIRRASDMNISSGITKGPSVATVGAIDSDGDTVIQRGW